MKIIRAGAALLVICGLFAVMAGSAMAEPVEFHSETENTTWEATSTKSPVLTNWTVDKCGSASYVTQTSARSVSEMLAPFTLNNCSQYAVAMNGCKFRFNANGSATLGCETGKGITETFGTGWYEEIALQSGIPGLTFENIGVDTTAEVIVRAELKAPSVLHTGGAENKETTRISAEWRLKGYVTGTTTQTGVWVG